MGAAGKVESDMRQGTPSSIESTPDHDAVPEASHEQPAQPQKRKGGRKPVRATDSRCYVYRLTSHRSMPRLRSVSSATARRRLRFGSGGPNTSSSSRQPSSRTRRRLQLCSKAIDLPPTNASCFGTRIPCWSVSCLRKVMLSESHACAHQLTLAQASMYKLSYR